MATKRILKKSFRITGSDANDFICAIQSDESLLDSEQKVANPSPMYDAIQREKARRDMLPGNYQI